MIRASRWLTLSSIKSQWIFSMPVSFPHRHNDVQISTFGSAADALDAFNSNVICIKTSKQNEIFLVMHIIMEFHLFLISFVLWCHLCFFLLQKEKLFLPALLLLLLLQIVYFRCRNSNTFHIFFLLLLLFKDVYIVLNFLFLSLKI